MEAVTERALPIYAAAPQRHHPRSGTGKAVRIGWKRREGNVRQSATLLCVKAYSYIMVSPFN